MTTRFDPRAATTAGAAWLDANRPGWAQEIDVEALDMEAEDDCIRGQLAIAGLDQDTVPWADDADLSVHIGMGLKPSDKDYWPLQVAWFDRLAERGVVIPESYREREQWDRRYETGEWAVFSMSAWDIDAYMIPPGSYDDEPVWYLGTYHTKGQEGGYNILGENLTVEQAYALADELGLEGVPIGGPIGGINDCPSPLAPVQATMGPLNPDRLAKIRARRASREGQMG